MTQQWCSAVPEGLRLTVQVVPNARKNEIAGVVDNALRIRLQAQPIEGKANNALIKYLADMLDIPKSAIHLIQGHTGRRKLVRIDAPYLAVSVVQDKLLPKEK